MRYDVAMMNPPYDNGLHMKFLYNIADVVNTIVSVQPGESFLGKKKDNKLINRIGDHYVDIEALDDADKSYFDAGIYAALVIIHIDNTKDKYIQYNGKTLNSCYEISHFIGDDLFEEFNAIINKYMIKTNSINKFDDSFYDHVFNGPWKIEKNSYGLLSYELNKDYNSSMDDTYVLRMAAFQGNTTLTYDTTTNECIDTFEHMKFKTLKSKKWVNEEKPYYSFGIKLTSDKKFANNVWNFIRTDFARACLYLIKTSMHLDRGELKYIPWFDFSDPIFDRSPKEIDDFLFEKYGISQEIRKHIEEILPDYYGIRR